MATATTSPEPHDAEPGHSVPERSIPIRQVRAREPEPVGGSAEPPRHRAEQLCGEFASTWDGVSCGDVMTVITIAVAVCRIAAIVVPLFMGTESAKAWHGRQLLKATRRHFPRRTEDFHEAFASELTEYLYALPDNGVTQAEVTLMLSELQANGTR